MAAAAHMESTDAADDEHVQQQEDATQTTPSAAGALAKKSKRAKLDLAKMEEFKKRAEKRGVVRVSPTLSFVHARPP